MMAPATSSEIRGTTEGRLSPEFIIEVGKTIGMQYNDVLISRNLRPNSTMAFYAVCAGITAAGGNVRDAGRMAAPAMPFASKGAECCIMIGSPDKTDENSMFLSNVDGSLFNESQMRAVSSGLEAEKELPPYSRVGRIRKVTGGLEKYRSKVIEYVGSVDCRVVMDCASDCTCFVAPHLMADLGADLTSINSHPDGRSPGRPPALEEQNLKNLSKSVKSSPGSIGIAFNSNGTRLAVFDEEGNYLNGGTTLAVLMAGMKPGRVALPVDASLAVTDALQSSEITWTRRGHRSLGETVRTKGLDMGGNMNGYFVFPGISYSLDGMTAGALMAGIAGGMNLSQLVSGLTPSFKSDFSVPYHGYKNEISKSIHDQVSALEFDSMSEAEGWRVNMESGWFLINLSEKDETVYITAEGKDKMYGASLMGIATDIVKSSIKKLSA